MTKHRRNEHGVALVVVAVFMVVILAFTAVGIDVARLAFTATEVQSIADAAARGGAKQLLDQSGTPLAGRVRAKAIANQNIMNGTLAPNADVLVDEGHYNLNTQQFECCAVGGGYETPCCNSGSWGDVQCIPSNNCGLVTAVLAQPRTDVNNLFAGVFNFMDQGHIANAAVHSGNETSRVQKLAIASPLGPGAGCGPPLNEDGQPACPVGDWPCYCANGAAPCLPIAAPSCRYTPGCTADDCLPELQVSNATNDTAAWTGFQSGHSVPDIRSFMDVSFQGKTCNAPGSGNNVPEQEVDGPVIDVTNGGNGVGSGTALSTPFGLVQCLWQKQLGCTMEDGKISGFGGTVFSIPIFDLGESCSTNMTGDRPIVGFATVSITNVVVSGNGQTGTRRIEMQTISNSSIGGQPGGACFGTNCQIVMTR